MEDESAAASVLRLLTNSALPETAQLPILSLAVPLLERQELPPLFSVKDTTQLLMHLQVYSDSITTAMLSAWPRVQWAGNFKANAYGWVGLASRCMRLIVGLAIL